MAEPKSGEEVPADLLPDKLKPKTTAAPKSGDEVPMNLLPDKLKPATPAPAPTEAEPVVTYGPEGRHITFPEENIFASKEALRKGLAESMGWTGITEDWLKDVEEGKAPPPKPAQPLYEEPRATISAAQPFVPEPWYKTGARILLPKWKGIEESLLGPDPDDYYDKARVDAEIAAYRTIKPGQSLFSVGQLARPFAAAAGAVSEVGKLGSELGVQTYGLGRELAGKPVDIDKAREAWAEMIGVPKGMAKEALEPQATKRVFRALGGEEAIGETPTAEVRAQREAEAEREKYFPKPSLPVRVGEDISGALNGLLTFFATDVIPVLPAPEVPVGESVGQSFEREAKAAYKRGEEFPAGTAAFAPIVVKAGQQLVDGKYSDALDTIAEKPATIALSILPMLHALGPNAPRALSNWAYSMAGSALKLVGGKPAQWGATLARWFSDPVVMENDLKSAKSEAIYERARSDAGKSTENVRKAVDSAIKYTPKTDMAGVNVEGQKVIQAQRLTPEGKMVVFPEEATSPDLESFITDQDAAITERLQKAGETITDPKDAAPTKLTYQQLQDTKQALTQDRAKLQGDIYKATQEGQKAISDVNSQVATLQAEAKSIREGNVPPEVLQAGEGAIEGIARAKEAEIRIKINERNARLSELEDNIAEMQDKSSALYDKELRVRKEILERQNRAQATQAKEAGKVVAEPDKGVFTRYGRLGKNPNDTLRLTNIDSKGNVLPVPEETRTLLQGLFEENPDGTWRATKEAKGALDPIMYELPGTLVDSIVSDLTERYPTKSRFTARGIDPNTGKPSSMDLNEYQRDLGGIVAKGVIDVLENQAAAALRDPRIVSKVAKRLVESVEWDDKASKAKAYDRLTTLLRNSNGDVIITLPGLEPIDPVKLAVEVNKALMGEKKYQAFIDSRKAAREARAQQGLEPRTDTLAVEDIPPQMKKAILDRVLPQVENEAFKQSLRESFAAERLQLPDNEGGYVQIDPQNAPQFAEQAIKYVQNTGSPPISVRVGTEAGLGLLLQELGNIEGGEFSADAISRYVKPSAELRKLGFTEGDYVDPAFNSAYTSIIKAMDKVSSYEDAFFGRFVQNVKRAYTSRNLGSAMNNLKSNILLFTSYYGLSKGIQALYGAVGSGTPGVKTIFDRYLMREPIDLGKAGAREKAIFDGIRESGVIDSNAAKAEGILLDEGAGVGPSLAEAVGADGVGKALRYYNDVQDRFYQFGDQYYKFQGAMEETGRAFKVWDKLKEGDRATINFGKYGEKVVEKLPNGEARYIEPVYDSNGKLIGERIGDTIDEAQLAKVFAKEGARLAGDKFVDFKRVPQMVNWLKTSPAGIGGLASLFTTWYWKMMDIPLLKKGIVSHFIESPEVIKNVSGAGSADAASYLKWENVKNAFGRSALFGIAQRYTYQAEGEKREKLLQRVLNWEKGAMPTTNAFISQADPFQAVYLDAGSANFLGPSDAAARVMALGAVKLGETGIKAYRTLINDAADAADIPRDVVVADLEASVQEAGREQNYVMREMRRLYTEQKAGILASPREFAQSILLRGGGPLFDLTSVITNPKSTWDDVGNFTKRTLFQVGLGGTNKRIFVDTIAPELIARYTNASPAEKSLIYAEAQNKLSSYPFNPDRFGYPVVERFVEGVLGLGWKTAYISQYGADGKTDIGKVGNFMREYEKGLKNSLEKEYKQRYELLVDAGASADDPRLKELTKKYNYLSIVVDKQINAMNMKLDEIYKSPKYRNTTP